MKKISKTNSNEKKQSRNPTNDMIFQELQRQSRRIDQLTNEISQLKQLILLSRNSFSNPRSSTNSTLTGIQTGDHLLNFDRPINKTTQPAKNQQSHVEHFSLPVNIQELLENLTEKEIKLIGEYRKSIKEIFNSVVENITHNNLDSFITNVFKFYSTLLQLFLIISKKVEQIDDLKSKSLIEVFQDLGPLPIVIDRDSIDFINVKYSSKDLKIGSKTAKRIFSNLEITINSVDDFLALMLHSD